MVFGITNNEVSEIFVFIFLLNSVRPRFLPVLADHFFKSRTSIYLVIPLLLSYKQVSKNGLKQLFSQNASNI